MNIYEAPNQRISEPDSGILNENVLSSKKTVLFRGGRILCKMFKMIDVHDKEEHLSFPKHPKILKTT